MADGRKIPYIIEMIADDTTLRNQMKKWNWEDIMGTKGKGFADILGQEGKEAKEKIEDALMGLNLDWVKIFGMDKLEAALSRTFAKSRKKLDGAIPDVDTKKIQTTIEFLEGLGKAFDEMGAKFEAGSAARSLAPLLRTLEQIPDATKKIEAAFGSLSDKLDKSNKPITITPSFDFAKTDKDVENLKRKLEGLSADVKVEIKGNAGKEINGLVSGLDAVQQEIEETKIALENTVESDVSGIKKLQTQLANAHIKAAEYYRKLDTLKDKYRDDMEIEGVDVDDLSRSFKVAKKSAEKYIGLLSKTSSGDASSAVNIPIAVPTADDIRAAINAEITKLNKRKDALQAVKLTVDDSIDSANNSTVEKTAETVSKSFEKIDNVIETKTAQWREKIINAFKVNKKEIDVPFTAEASAEMVFDQVQQFFEENKIEIRLNKDAIVQQLKQAIEEGGLPAGGLGGGGTVSLDPKTLASAFATGLQAFFTGDFTPVTGEKKPVKEIQEKPKRAFYLDPQNEYNQEVAKTFKEVLDYALADGGPNKKVRGFIEDKLVGSEFWDEKTRSANLDKLAKGSSIGLVSALSHITERYGETLVDDVNQLIKDTGKNKLLNNFRSDLTELLRTQNIKQITGDEHTKDLERADIWADYLSRGRLTAGFGKLRAKPEDLKIPEIEELDTLVKLAKDTYGEDSPHFKQISTALDALKTARASMTDVNDANQKEEFLKAVDEFKTNTQSIYWDLRDYLKSFEWGIDVKGFKKQFGLQSASGVDRLWRAIGGDESRIVKPHLYRAPDSISSLVEQRPDRTDVLYRDTKVKDFKARENTSKKWEEPSSSKDAEKYANMAKAAEKERKDWEDSVKSLRDKHIAIKQEISQREDSITAVEKNIQVLSTDNKKIAGARKRLQNRTEAFDRAEIEYNDLEKARIKAAVDYLDAQEHQQKVESKEYKDIDYADSQIRKFEEQQKNPLKYRKDMVGEFEIGEDGTNRLNGGVYQDAYNNNRYYRDLAKENAKNAKLRYEYLIKQEDKLRQFQTKAANEGDVDEVDDLEREIQENRKKIAQYKADEQREWQEAERYQQEIAEILRKRNGTSKKDKADFARDAKEYAKRQLEMAKQRRDQYGEDPRDVAKAETQRAERNAQLLDTQTAIAKTARDKAQKELDSVQDDEWIKRVKQIDEQVERVRDMKEENERQKKRLAEIEESLRESVKSKPQSAQDQLNKSTEKIDDLIATANKAQENLDATIAEAKQVEQWVDDAIGSDGYKKPEYDIKHTEKNQTLFDKSLARRRRATYLSNVADGSFAEGDFVPEDLTEKMSSAINSVLKSREIIQKLSLDFGFDKFTSEDAIKNEAQRRLTESDKSEDKLHPIIQEYYQKIVGEGQNAASQWLNHTLESARVDVEKQTAKLQSFADKDSKEVQALKPKLDEADVQLREVYQKRVAAWFNDIDKKTKIVEKGEAEGATEEAKKAGALATKEIEDIYALINKAIKNYTSYFSTPDFARKMADLSVKYAETPLTEEIKNDPVKRREVEAKNKAVKTQLEQERRKLRTEERETLEKELLAENQSVIESRDRNLYSNYIAKITASSREESGKVHSAIESSERYNLLLTRQAELLAEISSATLDGKDTEELRTSLSAINEELLKYQQYLTNVGEDIIKMEQKVALDRALGVPKKELDKQYADIDKARADAEKAQYEGLKKRQTDLLAQIKADTKEGKSTEVLSQELKNVNEELLKRETTQRRLEQLGANCDLYKADIFTVEQYNKLIEEQIRLEQKLALIKAQGGDASQTQKDLRKQRNAVNAAIKQYQEDRIKGDAANSPYVQALDYIRETQKQYDDALQKRYAIKGRRSKVERQLDDVRRDDSYSTSWQYKKHQRDVKDELTTEYRYSDEYKSDRKKGWETARKETVEYIEEAIRAVVEKKYKDDGKDIDSETVRKEIKDEVDRRTNETMYRLEQTLGKDGMTIDPAKMPEAYALFSEGGWQGIRDNIEKEFEDSNGYKALIEERRAKRKEALDKEIAAIQQESEETIAMIRTASEENYEPLKQRMNKISHADLDQMMTNFQGVISDPKKTRNREAMIASLGNAARSAGATKDQRSQLERELKTLGNSAIKDVRSWFNRFIPSIFPTGDELRDLARESLIFEEEEKTKSRVDKMESRYNDDKFYADKDTEKQMREKIDTSLQRYMVKALENFELTISEDKFLKEAGISNDILNKFKTSMKENVYKLVENYASSLEVQGGVINGRDIREEVEQRLQSQLDILEQHSIEAEKDIANIERQRRAAMQFGGIKTSEIADAEVLREQAVLEAKLTLEKERQKELTDQIARLEKEGASSEELGRLGEALDKSNENVRKLEMFVANKDTLMEIQHQALKDEKVLEKLDLDQQKLYYEAKKAAAEADLESGDERVKKSAQDRFERFSSILERIDGKIVERDQAERDKHNPIKMLAGALKEALGGAGGLNIDATGLATEATLAQILAVLTGGKVVEGSARSEVAASKNVDTDKMWKILNAAATKAYNDEKVGNKTPDDVIRSLVDKIKNPDLDDKTKTELQVALQKAITAFSKVNDKNPKLEYKTGRGGDPYPTLESIEKYLGFDADTLKSLKLTKAQATKLLAGQSGIAQAEPKSVVAGDGGISTFAKDETLIKILDVLNKIKTGGVKRVGSKATEKAKEPKVEKTEAELIKERALKDKDAVLGIAGSSKLKSSYEGLVAKLTEATELTVIKKLAQQISALGFNIKKDSADWDMKVAQSDKIFNVKKSFGGVDKTTGENKLRTNMENLAKKYANEEKSQYEFLGFDGKQLTYQLTNIQGEVRKVTMEWSELNNQVAITSDKSVNKMDDLAGKIKNFGDKFKDAIASGYLDKNDEQLKAFEEAVKEIQNKIDKGESFGKIDAARNRALRIANGLDSTVTKNKRLYSGTSEINAAKTKHNEMETRGFLNRTDLKIVEEYNNKYNELINTYEKFKNAGTLPKHQKELQVMAIKVKDISKKLEKSVAEAQQLEQLVGSSGMYHGKKMCAIKQLTSEEASNLEASMRSYLKTLGLANAEHVKYDHVHKRLTATQRLSNKAVADLEMKYNETTGALYAYQKAERESLTGMPAFLNGFKKKFNSIMQYLTMTMSIHQVLAQLRRGVQYIKEIDLALTELRKVTDETEETYEKFLQTAAKTGERLGATISAVTEATATFAKLGYSMAQATEMAEAAIVYKNVGDNIASTEDAADSIISTMKGFGLEATESMAIVDKFNEVGNRFAITSQGIGEALRLSASALNEGKNSLDESIALITAANEVVNDPSSVGTALKTLTLRLRGSKTELEEMGEDVTDMATTTSQLQAKLLALTGGKVDIMLDANTFKNTTQILREMADAWEDMNDIQRAEWCPYVQKCA
jgi:TP901 family phage tail tape measure protein